jgi:hypothetical protein
MASIVASPLIYAGSAMAQMGAWDRDSSRRLIVDFV